MHTALYQEQQQIADEQLLTRVAGMVQAGAGGLGLQVWRGHALNMSW